jgi:S1-C subfamily serine protease
VCDFYEVTFRWNIPHIIEELLNADPDVKSKVGGKRIRVINAGVAGFVYQNNLMRYLAKLRLFQPDLVVAVDGVVIGDDSYLFDKLMDGRAGGEAEIDVARNGSTETLRVPVAEADAAKVLRFVSFSGGVFTPYTREAKLETGENSDGVLLVRADKGSPFYRSGAGPALFTAVNGERIKDLAAFEKAVSGIKDKGVINFISMDLGPAARSPRAGRLNADLKRWPLKTYEWSPSALDWTAK